jgi:hypothetical protein
MCFLFTSIGILSFHLNSRVRQIGGASNHLECLGFASVLRQGIFRKSAQGLGQAALQCHWNRVKRASRASRYCPESLFVPSEADFFLPHARWRIAEGFHPKLLTREFHLFSRQVPPAAAFTIHRLVPTAGIAPAAFSFACCCSFC